VIGSAITAWWAGHRRHELERVEPRYVSAQLPVLGRGVEHRIIADRGGAPLAAGAASVRLTCHSNEAERAGDEVSSVELQPEARVDAEGRLDVVVASHDLSAVQFEPTVARRRHPTMPLVPTRCR
jgi:hypothetical protein